MELYHLVRILPLNYDLSPEASNLAEICSLKGTSKKVHVISHRFSSEHNVSNKSDNQNILLLYKSIVISFRNCEWISFLKNNFLDNSLLFLINM